MKEAHFLYLEILIECNDKGWLKFSSSPPSLSYELEQKSYNSEITVNNNHDGIKLLNLNILVIKR